jgi:hypothetical protein
VLFRSTLYWLLLLTVVGLAIWRGDREVRGAALICLVATIGSLQAFGGFAEFGLRIRDSVAVIDVVTFAAFVAIAVRSKRFWPMWVAGLQLTAMLSHVMRIISPGLVQIAYEAAMRLWSYPLLIILGAAAWRCARPGEDARFDATA